MSGLDDVDSIMAELGLGGAAPAPKKAAPVRDSAPSHYSMVPNKQAIRNDDVDDIMAELGLGDTRVVQSQYGNVPLAPKSSAAGARQPAPQQQAFSSNMFKPKAQSPAEAEVDDLLADLGLGDSNNEPAGYSGARGSAAVQPGYSTGPGRGGRGGGVSSGPGGGRGGVSSGPGGARGRGGISSGPGNRGGMSSGPGNRGGMSSGPGGGRGRGGGAAGASSGPGRIGALATHTADGREIHFSGPPCAACEETIIGAVTNALDKQYHPDCFACVSCQTPFGEGEFLVHEGQPFCDACFNELFAVRCVTCSQPVTGRCIEVGEKKYHPEHFCCSSCGTPLAGKPYKEDDGDVFCAACKAARQRRVAKENGICGQCKQPIIGEYIMLRGQRMHPKHFRCEECGCAFSGGNCHEYEGKLYCKEDYLKLLKDICSFCHKPIIGRSFTALGRVWHPEHFVCNHCKEPLGTASYMEKDGQPYCVPEEHEILTSRGFLDLDAYQAVAAADPTLLVASYNVAAKALVFEAPTRLLQFPSATRQLVELSNADEMVHHWSADSDSHGLNAGRSNNGVSMLVTKEHNVFAQLGNAYIDKNGTLLPKPVRAAHAKYKAGELLKAAKEYNVVRQLAVAEAGVQKETVPDFCDELALHTPAQRALFYELYGFWLGNGTLHWQGQLFAAVFSHVNEADNDWLEATLTTLGVPYAKGTPSSAGLVTITIQSEAWNRVVAAEYMHKYKQQGADESADEERRPDFAGAVDEGADAVVELANAADALRNLKTFATFPEATDGPAATALHLQRVRDAVELTNDAIVAPAARAAVVAPVDAEGRAFDAVSTAAGSYMQPEGIKSAKWFAHWVWRLGKESLRHVLAGLRRADGCAEQCLVWTSSARFRDEIQRVCLMAGYTAHFRSCDKAHSGWAVYFAESDGSPSGENVSKPSLFKARGEIRERQYTGRVWCFNMPSGFIWVRRVAKDEHGVVTKASRPLISGNCELHWHALFGSVCARCDKAIMGGVIRAVGKNFHQACFTCSGCDGQMTDGHYEWETKAMCKKCFMKLPADVRKRIETKRKEQLKAEKAREKASS